MDKISVSKMAKMHRISRQTLIYYDKIGLFKPAEITENGYRYYHRNQIPVLREICYLRLLKVPIEEIPEYIDNRTTDSVCRLFKERREKVMEEIEELNRVKKSLEMRLSLYHMSDEVRVKEHEPSVRYFNERKVVFTPVVEPITSISLHNATMQNWDILLNSEVLPLGNFGYLIKKSQLEKENMMAGSGVYMMIPDGEEENVINGTVITLPAGDYVTIFDEKMPYNPDPVRSLLDWMKKHNLEAQGDVINTCILDTTFHTDKIKEDFGQIQIPYRLDE